MWEHFGWHGCMWWVYKLEDWWRYSLRRLRREWRQPLLWLLSRTWLFVERSVEALFFLICVVCCFGECSLFVFVGLNKHISHIMLLMFVHSHTWQCCVEVHSVVLASYCPRGLGSEERIGFFCSVCVDWYESFPFLVMLCNHPRMSRVSRVCGCSELCLLGDCCASCFVFFWKYENEFIDFTVHKTSHSLMATY